jgi:hypothetical protein
MIASKMKLKKKKKGGKMLKKRLKEGKTSGVITPRNISFKIIDLERFSNETSRISSKRVIHDGVDIEFFSNEKIRLKLCGYCFFGRPSPFVVLWT